MSKTLKKTLLTMVIAIFVCMLNTPISNAASSSLTGSKTVTVGDSVTVTASVSAGAWNLTLSGNGESKSLVGQTTTQGNSSASTSITFTASKAGTYTFTLSGDISDYDTEVTESVSKTCTITVKEKTSSGGNNNSGSNGGSSNNSGPNNNSGSNNNSSSTSKTPNFTSVNETVYATRSVNVRQSWSTSSSAVGSLSEGQSVTRIGKGDNGWSRVTFNGSTAYISSSYLTTEKPEEKANNSALKELNLLQGTLTPEFSKDVKEYTTQVGTDVSELKIDAVSEDEKAFIFEKMKAAKIKNLSAYLRKAAIDEKIEIHDYSGLKEINYNLRKIGVNINQIAKRINETNSIYQSDMEDIQRKVNEVWHILTFIQSRLHLENQ
jgi:uncharacterized protein YgiM (DUF1202 family)